MELILHIGEAKTGTTSIQHTLLNNKALLLKQGILCHLKNHFDHFNLIYALGGRTRAPEHLQEKIKKNTLLLINEIRELSQKTNVKYILLSSEYFFSFSLERQLKLIDVLGIKFKDIKLIAYIRNPADLYLSMVQQRIKADHTFDNPYKYIRDLRGPLKRWQDFVGKNNMTLRAYHKNTLICENVVDDFFEILKYITGINVDKISYPRKKSNTSLGAEQMILIQKYRRDFLSDQKGFFHSDSDKVLTFFEEINSLELLPLTKANLKKNLHQVIIKNNIPFLKDIDDEFGTNFSTIFSSCSYHRDHEKSYGTYEDIADILESFNEKNLCFLTNLLPEYNDSLKSLNFNLPSNEALSNPIFNLCYSRFLNYKKLYHASRYFLKQSFNQAIQLEIDDPKLFYSVSVEFKKHNDLKNEENAIKKAKELESKNDSDIDTHRVKVTSKEVSCGLFQK